MLGTVVKSTGSWYLVQTDENERIECKIKGNFRLKGIRSTNPIAVGDRVEFEKNKDGIGLIYKICDRKNYIIRRASNLSKEFSILAANLDMAALVVTLNYPETSTVFIDRFLAVTEAYNVPACLIINKTDLYGEEDAEYLEAIVYLYENIGYSVFKTSALTGENLSVIKNFLSTKQCFCQVIRELANHHYSTHLIRKHWPKQPTYRSITIRECILLPFLKCIGCRMGVILLTHRVSRDLV
jgi:ribosome biogenesis GTPase